MDIGTLYQVSARRWAFLSIGVVVFLAGLLNLFLYIYFLFVPDALFFIVPPVSSLNLTFTGIAIILVASEKKKMAFYFVLFLLFYSLLQMSFFEIISKYPVYKLLTIKLIPGERGALSHRSLVSGMSFLLIDIALLCLTLKKIKERPLWIAGISSAIALAVGFYFSSFAFANVSNLLFCEIHLAPLTSFLIILISLSLLFYVGSRFAYFFPKNFVWWLPTFVSVTTFFIIFTTWLTFQAREKELVIQGNRDSVNILKEHILDYGQIYFGVLNRMKKRWESNNFSENSNSDIAKELQSAFPWLIEYGLINAEKKISDYSPLTFSIPHSIYSAIHTKKNSPSFGNSGIFFIKNDPKQILIIYHSPFTNPTSNEETYYFAVSDAKIFFANVIQNFLKRDYAIELNSQIGKVFAQNTHKTKYKQKYLIQESFDFFGDKLSLAMWPLPTYVDESESPAKYFHLALGIFLVLTVFFSLYLALIAHQKKLEADKANKEKTVFLANMSHEIRTPLHGIIGSCSLLELSPMDDYQKKWVSAIDRSGKMLLGIVDDLLDLSKIETATIALEPLYINVKNLLLEAVMLSTPAAQSKNIVLEFEYDPKMAEQFTIDGKRLRQIVFNIISNGIKFTKEGYVRLVVTEEKSLGREYIVLKIKDTGIGINANELDTIFKKHLSIDIRSEKGSGLGLAIVKRLVDLMKGKIEVESTPNSGSLFTVKIPVNEGDKKDGE